MKLWSNILVGNFCFPSKLPYDVTPEQALSHEEVRTRLDNSIRNMRAVTDKFLAAIISSVDKIPWVSPAVAPLEPSTSGLQLPVLLTKFCLPYSYGMRFIAKVLKDSLHEKFPDAGEDELLKVRPKAGTFFPFQ